MFKKKKLFYVINVKNLIYYSAQFIWAIVHENNEFFKIVSVMDDFKQNKWRGDV